ncbi:MAG: DUF4433 domain-containing protein [Geoalkalibacter sp.]
MPHRVTELHNIMPIANMSSVLAHGIVSYERAAALPHASVALMAVQDRRDNKQVPGGLRLHQYANLYFCARNPMLFKRLDQRDSLCILRVSRRILAQQHVIITDMNASSDYVRFYRSPDGLRHLNFDQIYANDWRHPGNSADYYRHRSVKCAEVLVPEVVAPEMLEGAYVPNGVAEAMLRGQGFTLPIQQHPHLFFIGDAP